MDTDNIYIEFSGGGFMPYYGYTLYIDKESFFLGRGLDWVVKDEMHTKALEIIPLRPGELML